MIIFPRICSTRPSQVENGQRPSRGPAGPVPEGQSRGPAVPAPVQPRGAQNRGSAAATTQRQSTAGLTYRHQGPAAPAPERPRGEGNRGVAVPAAERRRIGFLARVRQALRPGGFSIPGRGAQQTPESRRNRTQGESPIARAVVTGEQHETANLPSATPLVIGQLVAPPVIDPDNLTDEQINLGKQTLEMTLGNVNLKGNIKDRFLMLISQFNDPLFNALLTRDAEGIQSVFQTTYDDQTESLGKRALKSLMPDNESERSELREFNIETRRKIVNTLLENTNDISEIEAADFKDTLLQS